MTPPNPTPEQLARQTIDAQLRAAGWVVQSRDEVNLAAGSGVAVREFPLASGHGFADYLLFVDGQAVGVLEAKKHGEPLRAHERQATRYAEGLPSSLKAPVRPLPFLYLANGVETLFANLLDPEARSRRVFAVHRPETLGEWLQAKTLRAWVQETGAFTEADDLRPSTLRARLRALPELPRGELYENQVRAITGLERSFRENRPRALIQMATGSGKTRTAVAAIYRLIKFGGARRVLFLVDRTNLGKQAETDGFGAYRTPDDHRKFTELYNVQRLQSQTILESSKVVITTIQRLYSMLRGEPEFDAEAEVHSPFAEGGAPREPLGVVYNRAIPPEHFDVIFIDECHRSIYTLWRQVLEYFDAFLVGLTATPAAHTYGFFQQNLVMEYGYEESVADGVNVDFEVYRIRTRITEAGSTIEATSEPVVGYRDRRTRALRWAAPDEPVSYGGNELDRAVVAKDQIRTVVRAFREKLFTELFPGRREVPKTLVFCKSDNHAEDVVEVLREEFGRGNEFCRKITYNIQGVDAQDLIQEFRNSFHPRIAVTVDLVATGTDIKPVEVLIFLRMVKSRVLFEQMKGRGVRKIDQDELRAVTPDAVEKSHFVLVDCVGVTEQEELADSQPLERMKSVPLQSLLEQVAFGSTEVPLASSLASRLTRIERRCSEAQRERLLEASGGVPLTSISGAIVRALDPETQLAAARASGVVPAETESSEAELDAALESAREQLLRTALQPIAARPTFRQTLLDIRREHEQIVDELSRDEVLEAGFSPAARLKAQLLVQSFEEFLREKKDEVAALQVFYGIPHARRLRFADVKALAAAIAAPPLSCTPERLWHAYELLEEKRVRGASGQRLLTDLVSLIRFALKREPELVPFQDLVHARFNTWLRGQGGRFTPEQVRWLEMIREQIATSVEIGIEDFDEVPFAQEGGLGRAQQVFGGRLGEVLLEVSEVLAA
ncbi:MAG: DEAD/DEAH box helicase family protein [Planctomycetes bacterium]|nr:DEAD/DEAH box helicase family protein [Planctomycetota bacterium]